jgi:hypothetical protein
MRRTLLLAVLIAVAAQPQAAQTPAPPQQIGRLFFTPAERAQLDLARIQKKAASATAAAEPPAPEPAPQVVTYGGIVRRSDGKSTLWINNRAVDEKEALAGLSLKGRVRPDGAVSLQVPEKGGTIDLKVGQSVELQSGRVAEARKRAPESKAPSDQPGVSEAKDGNAKVSPEGTAPAELKPSPAASPSTPQDREKTVGVGLKMDLGGRALGAAESQRLSTAPR